MCIPGDPYAHLCVLSTWMQLERRLERDGERGGEQLGRRWWRAGKVDTRPRGRLIIADPEDRPTPWGPPLFVLFPSYTNARSTTDI